MTIENKTIKIATVAALIPTLFMSIWFIAGISFSVDAQGKRIEKQEQRIDAQTTLLLDIRDRIIKLEAETKRR